MLYLSQSGEEYRVDSEGRLSRACLGWKHSDSWLLRGVGRFNNFGRLVEYVPFERIPEKFKGMTRADFMYKNGKGKWYAFDLDHGAKRMWGRPLHNLVASE